MRFFRYDMYLVTFVNTIDQFGILGSNLIIIYVQC